jgi:hypothetical protein
MDLLSALIILDDLYQNNTQVSQNLKKHALLSAIVQWTLSLVASLMNTEQVNSVKYQFFFDKK